MAVTHLLETSKTVNKFEHHREPRVVTVIFFEVSWLVFGILAVLWEVHCEEVLDDVQAVDFQEQLQFLHRHFDRLCAISLHLYLDDEVAIMVSDLFGQVVVKHASCADAPL
jgi:hypothetical protein